jgi:ferric-dicitrate binding protein FerR (iron transport regulator)
MQGKNSTKEDVVIQGLPELVVLNVGAIAVFSWLAVASWSDARRREREAYYKSEVLKKIAETPGAGAVSALELKREEERIAERRRHGGLRLGGLITLAVGIGMMVFLRALEHEQPVYLVGLIPLLIGVALLAYSYLLAPKE